MSEVPDSLAHVPAHETSTLKRSNSQKSSDTKSSDRASPSSFWLATESSVEQSIRADVGSNEDGASEEQDTEARDGNDPEKHETLHAALKQVFPNLEHRSLRDSQLESGLTANNAYLYHHSNTVSQPLTPLPGASPMMDWGSNMPNSPKSGSLHSLRLSDVDSPVEGDDGIFEEKMRSILDPEPPAFIMPSLAMPDRRPITDRGRAMGSLRICVAGAQGESGSLIDVTNMIGSGKTSLIRTLVQQCEDIVHVDSSTPLSPSASIRSLLPSDINGVVEILASTKCYPPWWNELDDSRVLRRRKSGDVVLERNLCFVDTPGFDVVHSKPHVVQYIEKSFSNVEAPSGLSDLERLNLVTGKGSPLVDAVIFVFSDGKSSKMSSPTNVSSIKHRRGVQIL
jgi:hypothetical protein